MGIQTAAVLYPVNTTTVDTPSGGDIKLLDSAQAGADDDTQTVTATHTQDNAERTFNPANTGITTSNAVGSGTLQFGWALRRSEDMTPASRVTLDASGNGNHGTLVGTPSLVASPFAGYSNALRFSGVAAGASSDGVNLGSSNSFALRGNSVFCLDVKFKPTAFQAFKYIATRWGADLATQDWVLYIGGNDGTNMELRFAFVDTADAAITLLAPSTHWVANNSLNNVRVTYDGTTVRMFINDMTTACVSYSTTQPKASAATTTAYLARGPDAAPATGNEVLDEVRFSNVVRSDDMSAVYEADANTLGLWHLDAVSCNAAIPVGTATVNLQCAVNQSGGTYAGGTYGPTWKCALWKYDPLTDDQTLIEAVATVATPTWDYTPVTGDLGTFKAVALTIAIDPLVEFEPGEILVLEIGLNTGTIPNPTVGTATWTYTLRVDNTNTNITWAANQNLCEVCSMTGVSSGTSESLGASSIVLPAIGVSSGTSTVSGVLEADAVMVGISSGTSTVDGVLAAVAEMTGTAEGSCTVEGIAGIVIPTVGTCDIGGGGGDPPDPVVITEQVGGGGVRFIPISELQNRKHKKRLEEFLKRTLTNEQYDRILNSVINKFRSDQEFIDPILTDDEEALLYIIMALEE